MELFTLGRGNYSEQDIKEAARAFTGWSSNLTEEKQSFHLRGNHRILFDGSDAATLHSHGYAWNRMERGALEENGGNPLWEVWGTYEHGFERTAEGWKVNFMPYPAAPVKTSYWNWWPDSTRRTMSMES